MEEKFLLDKQANQFKRKILIPGYDYILIYLKNMRKIEKMNKKTGLLNKFSLCLRKYRLRRLSVKTGISISPGCFEGGLTLYHWGSIIVNSNVKGGSFITIQSDVNISENVIIGDNVYIAPGAKILANVSLAEGVIIGANSVVTKNISEPYTTWAGVPAKKISEKGYINRLKVNDKLNETVPDTNL